MVVGDLNGDGRADLAVATSSSSIAVLLGNGDGTFQSSQSYVVADTGGGLAVGDFNADKKLDLVASGSTSGLVSILPGDGHGAFQQAVSIFGVGSVAVGDFNGDGQQDLAGI